MKIPAFNRCMNLSTVFRQFMLLPIGLVASICLADKSRVPEIPSPDTLGWIEFRNEAIKERVPKYDDNFEEGEAIYKGKGAYEKYDYCVMGGDSSTELKPLKRKNVNALRRLTVSEFYRSLYDCNDPERLVLSKISSKEAGKVIYYLNQRYKLRLQN